MWRSFGKQLAAGSTSDDDFEEDDHHDDGEEEEPRVVAEAKQKAGQLWSRFVEIAADITQQDDEGYDDEDGDYYEEEGGEGWAEDEDAIEGSWQQGEAYVNDGQQYYEEQYANDNASAEEENVWGEDEEVDFSMEQQQEDNHTPVDDVQHLEFQQQPPQQQQLFGGPVEMLSPIANSGANNHNAVDPNGWDLDEAEIYGEEGVAQQQEGYCEEQQQILEAPDDAVADGGGDYHEENAWDDSLNIGDDDEQDPLAGQQPAAEEEQPMVDQPKFTAPEDAPQVANAWEEDDLQLDDSTSPVEQQSPLENPDAADAGGGWDQDDGLNDLDMFNNDAVVSPNPHPTPPETMPAEGDAWDQDDGLNHVDFSNSDAAQQETDTQPEATLAVEPAGAWEQDDGLNDLDFSNTDKVEQEPTTAEDPAGAWDQDDGLNDLDVSNTDAVEEVPQPETTPVEEQADAWDQDDALNDLDCSNNGDDDGQPNSEVQNQPETTPAAEPAVAVGLMAENAWADESELNLEADNPPVAHALTPASSDVNAWGEDSALNFDINDYGDTDPAVTSANPGDGAWDSSDINFDDDAGLEESTPAASNPYDDFVDDEDASTVGQSNTGGEQPDFDEPYDLDQLDERELIQEEHIVVTTAESGEASSDELVFKLPSRRDTIRVSNKSKDSKGDDSRDGTDGIEDSPPMISEVAATSTLSDDNSSEHGGEGGEGQVNGRGYDATTLSSDELGSSGPGIAGDGNETQISLMTLKSVADSCPSRQLDNDEDEDEAVFGLVVDKIPELNPAPLVPATSAMTINSTAVTAPSVDQDIRQDDDMDGTYYGGSTVDGPPTDNAWEADDSSFGMLHETTTERIIEGGPGEEITNIAIPEEATADMPLTFPSQHFVVDGTPDIAVKTKLSSSMAVLSHSDETSVPSRDRDDDDEDGFKPVVDQIPQPLNLTSETSGWTANSLSVVADHVEQDVKEDDDMDASVSSGAGDGSDGGGTGWEDDAVCLDEELQGDTTNTQEGENVAVQPASATLQERSRVVVLDAPDADALPTKMVGSVAAIASAADSCLSGEHDSDEENEYGPVVDQIPEPPQPRPENMSLTVSSVAVVAHNVEEDVKLDDEMDASYGGGSTIDDVRETEWDNNGPALEDVPASSCHGDLPTTALDSTEVAHSGEALEENDRVVDLTPKMETRRVTRMSSNSMAVLAYSVNQDFDDDNEEDEEDDTNFGPIVDVTPAPGRLGAMTPNSTAVLRGDRRQDDTIDDGIGDINWDDECPDLEEEEGSQGSQDGGEHEESQAQQPVQTAAAAGADPVVLVDHTPAGETPRKGFTDASLAVLAPSDDGTCLSMDDDDDDVDGIDPYGEGVSYGPVVDITPAPTAQRSAPTAPSVSFSLVVEAHSIDEDFQVDEEMDETLFGDSTIDGAENGWGDDDVGFTEGLDEQDKDSSQPTQLGQDNTVSESALGSTSPQESNEKHVAMVDHTPRADSRRRVVDPSLVALAPSIANSCHSEENEDCDTITNEQDVYGQVVDHLPKLAPYKLVPTSSLAVGAASVGDDIERDDELDMTYFGESSTVGMGDNGWADDDAALEDAALNDMSELVVSAENGQVLAEDDHHVVDHTPLTEEPSRRNLDPSVVVLAPSDDGSCCRGKENGAEDGGPVFGPVVDMTPEIPDGPSIAMSGSLAVEARSLDDDIRCDEEMEVTLNGDSTIDGAGGWEEDDAALEGIVADVKQGGEADSSSLVDATEALKETQLDDNIAGVPVVLVDHTPSEIGSRQKNASVVAVSGTIGENDTQDDVPDWDQDAPVLESAASSSSHQTDEDHVVDRIPQRPESRYGDASTLVVADPSEVLSHVDDMLQEDNFGPIVDLTPPTRPSIPHVLSAAGSTVVVAPTVPPDDLDDADDTNAPDENGWDEPPEIEQAPNPQSGNEEETANRVREQVVDFLPPQEEEAAVDQNRDGWSEATGGAPSIFQVDPKEDEFGPVVDQLPARHSSAPFAAMSTASQVASSECEALAREDETEAGSKQEGKQSRVVVDPLPRPFEVGMQNLDSTASLAQSLASEDEDDDGKYGPVVDHLPTSRASLAPSRGGSTVDALATVSEVIDDDDDDDDEDGNSSDVGPKDGWGDDDDIDIDLSEHHQDAQIAASKLVPDSTPEEQQINMSSDRNMSVRFRPDVHSYFEPTTRQEFAEAVSPIGAAEDQSSQLYDAQTDLTSTPVSENAWDDGIEFDESMNNMDGSRASTNDISQMSSPERYAQFTEADTPPATPYTRLKPSAPHPAGTELEQLQPSAIALPHLEIFSSVLGSCETCANSTAIDCPCVKRILASSKEGWIPGENGAKIDFNKLLQTEITKRLLIEEESKALRLQLESLQNPRGANEVLDAVKSMQLHVQQFEDKLGAKKQECDELRSQNKDFQNSLEATQLELSEWEARHDQWNAREASLVKEIDRARSEIEASLNEENRKRQERENTFSAEIEKRRMSEESLGHQIDDLQKECLSLRSENKTLCSDLESCRQSLAEKEAEMSLLSSKATAADTEMLRFKQSIDELEAKGATNNQETERCQVLENELSSKKSEFDQLRSQMDSLQQRVQIAEAEKFERMKDEARLAKAHDEEIARLHEQMNEVIAREEEGRRLLEDEKIGSEGKVSFLEADLKRLSHENGDLEARIRDLKSYQETALSEIQSRLDQKMDEVDSVTLDLELITEENERLSSELAEQSKRAEQSHNLADDLRVVNDERDALQKRLAVATDAVATLQQRVNEQGVEEAEIVARRNAEIDTLKNECTNLRETLAANNEDLEHLLVESGRLAEENNELQRAIVTLKESCGGLEAALETARSDAVNKEATRTQLAGEIESLQMQLASITSERDSMRQEQMALTQRFSGIEDSLNRASSDSESNAVKIKSLEALLAKAQEELAASRQEIDAVFAERYEMEQSHAASIAEMSTKVTELEGQLALQHKSSVHKDEDIAELRKDLDMFRKNTRQVDTATAGRIQELENLVAGLEAQNVDMKNALDFHSAQAQEYQTLSGSLHEARDAALQERDNLAEDNEEMLVQFGLLNEQMDSYSQQIQVLQNQVQGYQTAAEAAKLRLAETQRRLEIAEKAARENGDQRDSRTDALERELNELRDEKIVIVQRMEDIAAMNAEKDAEIHGLTEKLAEMSSQLTLLEELQHNVEIKQSENEQLLRDIEEIKRQHEQLENMCARQLEEASYLGEQITQSQGALAALETRNASLESACSDRDHALQQKDLELREVHGRMHEASGSPEAADEMAILRDRLSQMEHATLESNDRIRELEGLYAGSLEELGSAREKISGMETMVAELQQESIARQKTEDNLAESSRAINDLTEEKSALDREVADLRSQLQLEQQRNAELAHKPSEIESLSAQLRALQETLEVSKTEHTAREEELQYEISGLRELMAQKETSITALQARLDSLDGQLRCSEDKAELEKANTERLKSELEEFHKQERESTARATSTADLLRFTRENAEDSDTLRSTVITLASALEKSEVRRAEAMDRLLKERETHADSLRRVSDSVKRFYTTLSFGES